MWCGKFEIHWLSEDFVTFAEIYLFRMKQVIYLSLVYCSLLLLLTSVVVLVGVLMLSYSSRFHHWQAGGRVHRLHTIGNYELHYHCKRRQYFQLSVPPSLFPRASGGTDVRT